MMKIKVVPSQLVPCGVSVCGGVSVSSQILQWGPAGADRTPFIFPLPLQTLFFCVCVCVYNIYMCVCVCVPTGLIYSVWVWCWSDWQPSSHRGDWEQLWEERDLTASQLSALRGRARQIQTGKRESKQINRIHRDEVWINKLVTNGCKMNDVLHVWFSQGPVRWLKENRQDKNELIADEKPSCLFIITLPLPWSHGWETLGTIEVYGKWLIHMEWCHT